MDKKKFIKKLKNMSKSKENDDDILLSLMYLNDEDSLRIFIESIKREKTRTGRYFTPEKYINILGEYKCDNHKEAVTILVDIILDSNPDVAYNAANALINIISRLNDIESELLPLIRLMNYQEHQSYLGSLDRAEIAFNILKKSKNKQIVSFLLNYLKAKYSDIDDISLLDTAKIIPYIDYDDRLICQLITSVKDCTHSYTIVTVFRTLNNVTANIENRYCLQIIRMIKDNFKYVDDNDKRKIKEDSYMALGNLCDDKVLPFLVESLELAHLKTYVPFAIKKLMERGILI